VDTGSREENASKQERERFQAKACRGLDPGWTPVRVKKVKTELGTDQSEPAR
jgi:hypothetical protein